MKSYQGPQRICFSSHGKCSANTKGRIFHSYALRAPPHLRLVRCSCSSRAVPRQCRRLAHQIAWSDGVPGTARGSARSKASASRAASRAGRRRKDYVAWAVERRNGQSERPRKSLWSSHCLSTTRGIGQYIHVWFDQNGTGHTRLNTVWWIQLL